MALYRKLPVVIEARQWDGSPVGATPIIDWVLLHHGTARYHDDTFGIDLPEHIAIDTLEGVMRATIGDYIIKGTSGEFYPCKPLIFEAIYEEAE